MTATEIPQVGGLTLWVKRTGDGTQYDDIAAVPSETVAQFKRRWVAQEKLEVTPSLVSLHLVHRGPARLTKDPAERKAAEEAATVLDPSDTLAQAGVTDGSWLVAEFADGPPGKRRRGPTVDESGDDVQPVPHSAVAFWSQLPNATVEGSVLRLASGTTFLGSSTLPDSMFIRADYVALWAEIQRLTASDLARIVISGNPGIGKSWFGLFVAFKLLSGSQPPTIVWESRRKQKRYLIRDGVVAQGTLGAFVSELGDTRTWYLVDEAVPPGAVEVEACTLVFSSPKRENYKETLKATASTIRYLPPWSWEEIDMCRTLLYPGDPVRTQAAVQEAFSRWGGIPRYVLEKLGDESAQLELQRSIVSTGNVDVILRSVGQIDTAPEASHRVLHIISGKPYIHVDIQFGSDYIQARVTELLLVRHRADLYRFVMRETDPLYATIRGKCFEVLAHETLTGGGEFHTRFLTGAGGRAIRTLQRATLQRFAGNKPENLASLLVGPGAGQYCQPEARNFPVLDALLLPGTLLQMTVAEQHAVDEAALAKILDTLALSSAELVFVVPPDKFDEFKAYKFKDTALGARVTQLALRVSFDVVVK